MSYSRPPPNVGDLISLKVDNLTDRISRRTLRRIFERYGPVGDVYIPRDRFTLEPRGFAFVRFYDKHHAEEAMDALDGVMLDGRELWVQMARHRRLLDFHQGRRQETPPQGQERQSHSLRLRRCRRSSARSRRHVRPDLASAAQSLHLAPVTVLRHPRDQALLEVPSPRSPDLSQQPRLGLDSEAFHQEESTGP
ncbi:unnamed protein product, partial [Rangifer tarandus platyrhynchus]